MRRQIRQGMFVAGCVLWAGALSAQAGAACEMCAKEQDKGPGVAAHKMEKIDKQLNLTEAQQAQVQQIRDEYAGRREPLKDQLAALKQEEHERIKAVLTPEQQVKFDAWKEKKEKRGKKR